MHKPTMQEFKRSSYLAGSNAEYIEDLYERFLVDPNSIEVQWSEYFQSLTVASTQKDVSHQSIRDEFKALAAQPQMAMQTGAGQSVKQTAVDQMIEAYRRFGHLNAKTDPLGTENSADSRLQLGHYQLTQMDLSSTFTTKELFDKPEATLNEIYTQLRKLYCGSIGVQYSTISNEEERHWLRHYVEKKLPVMQHSKEVKLSLLQQLIAAESLEKYLDVRYIGQKRFSIEGGDSLIPMLDELSKRARKQGVEELVIGMAHRGRLNVLLNIMGQSPKELFQEFEGTKNYGMTSGDVKYHKGYSRDVRTDSGLMHLALAFNPSHLAYICPVVMGSVRARQERHALKGTPQDYAMAVMIHGDAAFCGQGVIMETLGMSQTRAYHIGGTLHVILNNQVGFTTSNPIDSRSSHYCTDIAKMLDAPVFHVNGDDTEAVISITQLALDYRMTFHKDIVIDLVCYRRHGHQEVDEPRATQPLMYKKIKAHPTTRTLYTEQLVKEQLCSESDVKQWTNDYKDSLDKGKQVVETLPQSLSEHYAANWTPYIDQQWTVSVDTTVKINKLKRLGETMDTLPEGMILQKQVGMIAAARKRMTQGDQLLDWGYAEVMAYATLLDEGVAVRMSGEDCRRGTFFHRHSTFFDQETGAEYTPLRHLTTEQARVEIYDSLLAESGPMGFEYGYSTANPKSLVIWEAQFGDFANVAQVIIDQFISSGWQKWNRLSGLVLFLPHGYEGMGPEHSSARLERYLQLCAQSNIQVCVPTTPAQIFHMLRRQVLRPFRRPLIVMTPKSLLRHKLATSTLDNLAHGQLQLVIPEIDEIDRKKVTRIVLCSGKVYYDLLVKRREEKLNHVAIMRVEQLYPFPYDDLRELLGNYKNAKEVVWCQEEPKNQGAWFITQHRLLESLPEDQSLTYAGRSASAAPAAGYPALHRKQQSDLINEALGINE
jgi:2-oxoglutarate dehydrogenase E1 component